MDFYRQSAAQCLKRFLAQGLRHVTTAKTPHLGATTTILISLNTSHLPAWLRPNFPHPLPGLAASANFTSITQGVAGWGGQYYHSDLRHWTTDFLLRKDGVTSPCLRAFKEWLYYKRSLHSPLCPIFGSFLSYSLPGITGRLGNERLVVQRAL